MSFIHRLLSDDAGGATPPVHSPFWYLDDPASQMPSDVVGSAAGPQRLSVVYAAYRVISQTLASLPVGVYRYREDGGRERVREHPVERLFRRPNAWQTRYQLLQVGEGHRMLRGNAYYRIFDGRDGGYAGELWPLHPDRTRVVDQVSDGSLVYGWRGKDGQEKRLRQDQVLHIPGPSEDGKTGLSPLTLMRNSVALAMAAESYGARLFTNGASPSLILKHPDGILEEPVQKRLARQVADRTSGENAHLPLVLEDGLEVEKLGLTNEEAQFLGLRTFQVEDLLRFLGVPGVLVGYSDKAATYASAEQFFLAFVTHTIRPIAVSWEERLTAQLVPEPDHFVKFNLDAILRGDSAARANYFEKALRGRWMKPNEVRSKEELNPEPWGEDPNPIQGAAPEASPEDATAPPPPPQGSPSDEEDGDEKRRKQRRKKKEPAK